MDLYQTTHGSSFQVGKHEAPSYEHDQNHWDSLPFPPTTKVKMPHELYEPIENPGTNWEPRKWTAYFSKRKHK